MAAASPGSLPEASPGATPEASLPDPAAASQEDGVRSTADGAAIEGDDHQEQSPEELVDIPGCRSLATKVRRERKEPTFQLGAQLQTPLPEIYSRHRVRITWVLEPNLLKCQLKSSADAFKQMMDRMQEFYTQLLDGVGTVNDPQVGMYCVARFPEDNVWYRCSVQKVQGPRVEVYYVDYGNCGEVAHDALRCLESDFVALPCQAIECRLAFTRGLEGPDPPKQFFQGEFSCRVVAHRGPAVVALMSQPGGRDLSRFLVAAGFCEYVQRYESLPTVPC